MKIVLDRKNAYADSLRAYKVMINGREAGRIRQGQELFLDVENENEIAEVYLKVDWCRSNKVLLPYKRNETVRLSCQSNLAGWKVIMSPFYIIFLPHQYIKLWDFEDNALLDQ